MQFIKPEIATYCMGQPASAPAVLLAAATTGKRHSLPHARILIHQHQLPGRTDHRAVRHL